MCAPSEFQGRDVGSIWHLRRPKSVALPMTSCKDHLGTFERSAHERCRGRAKWRVDVERLNILQLGPQCIAEPGSTDDAQTAIRIVSGQCSPRRRSLH